MISASPNEVFNKPKGEKDMRRHRCQKFVFNLRFALIRIVFEEKDSMNQFHLSKFPKLI